VTEYRDETMMRLEALEMKIAYQEAAIDSLSATIYNQAQSLERLDRLFKDMAGKLKELGREGLPALPANERPPHY
jgi:SlyX protein